MLDYAFGGILEQFEDDFDSEDSEFLSYIEEQRYWNQQNKFSRGGCHGGVSNQNRVTATRSNEGSST